VRHAINILLASNLADLPFLVAIHCLWALSSPYPPISKVHREEGLAGGVAADQDRIIADRAREDVEIGQRRGRGRGRGRGFSENRNVVLGEEESVWVRVCLRAMYGLGLLSTPLWWRRWASIARTTLFP
jgi:hypothetical protein